MLKEINNRKFLDQTWTIYSCVNRVEEENFQNIDINKEFRELFKKYIPTIITKEINDKVIDEFNSFIESYDDFDIDDEKDTNEKDFNKKEFLRNLRISDSFEEEFEDVFERIDKDTDRNRKVLELLKKYHILNVNTIDTIENKNRNILKDNDSILYNIVKEALKILRKYENTFETIKDIQSDIIGFINESDEEMREEFCKEFLRIFNLMLQIRNYDKNNKYEYILSPVGQTDEKGILKFFNSSLDENSSRNIAQKGLILVKKIRSFEDDKADWEKLDLKVTDKEWISSVIGKKFN